MHIRQLTFIAAAVAGVLAETWIVEMGADAPASLYDIAVEKSQWLGGKIISHDDQAKSFVVEGSIDVVEHVNAVLNYNGKTYRPVIKTQITPEPVPVAPAVPDAADVSPIWIVMYQPDVPVAVYEAAKQEAVNAGGRIVVDNPDSLMFRVQGSHEVVNKISQGSEYNVNGETRLARPAVESNQMVAPLAPRPVLLQPQLAEEQPQLAEETPEQAPAPRQGRPVVLLDPASDQIAYE